MKRINLRDYYPHYRHDEFICVPNNIYRLFCDFELVAAAYRLRIYRHKAYYSLDLGDGIETEALFPPPMPDEVFEQKQAQARLYEAIAALPEKQGQRIYAHYFLGMSKTKIARMEGVSERVVRHSIERALRRLEKSLKNFYEGGSVLPKK